MVDGPGALSGRTLGGYRLGARLASSPHAEVYRASDDELGRELVIKLVPAGAASAAARERFVAEARVAARIDHPYATHVYGSGVEADGTCWMAMEWVRGATLAERVARHGPLRVDEAVELAGRLAEVVSTLHDQGLVHLDLKPDNILVVARGGRLLPRLCDFGLAAVPLDGPAGTPAYMAPEQWRIGDAGAPPVGPRADVYALAACVHFALTGAHAFGGPAAADGTVAGPAAGAGVRTSAGVARLAAAHADPARPRLPGSFPPPLADALVAALAIDPAARPGSALELAAALRGAIDARSRPRFDDAIVEAILANAPEPIAEAMAAWEAAPSERAAREALDELELTTARWLGLCAIALRRTHGVPPAGTAPHPAALAALAALATGSPSPTAWLALARDDAPVAPLALDLDRAARLAQPQVPASAGEQLLIARLVAVQRLLRAAAPVLAPRLVVRRGTRVERWSGVRRRKRPAIWVANVDALAEGVPALVDDEGAPLIALGGLAMIDAPAAGEPDELFVLAAGEGDATIVVAPAGYQRRIAGAPLGLSAGAAARDEREERGPYPGLMPFTADDAAWFVGREREVEDVANRLRDRSLLVVVGPSGVGKSSFALAGVAPATGARHVVVCRPGESPLAALAAALAAAGPELGAIVARAELLAAEGRVLVVIDQLEEVATRATAAEARELGAAIEALAAIGDGVRVLATVRDDFLVRVATATGLGGRLASGVVLLGPPDEAAMRRIVSEPAARVGYGFDDAELPAAMVAAVAGAASPLPLLSFAARALWSRRDRTLKQLRRRDHDAIGGVVGALARHADETVDALAPDARALVRPLLAALATAEGARVPVARADLRELLGGGAAAALVIERLVDARLLVSREPDEIELVHEALLAAWPRLAAWRRDDALAAQLRDAIRAAAQQWDARGRRRELLWRGEALDELRVWRRRHRVRLTPRDEAFCAASLREAQRRQRLVRAALIGGAIAAALALAVLVRANREARAQRSAASAASAQAERRLIDAWIEQGRVAALEDRPREALAWLDAAAEASGADDARLARLIATAAAALGDDHVVATFTAPVHVMAWSRSGRLLAAGGGSADPRVVVLGRDGSRVATLPAGRGNVTAVAFAPDDRHLAVVTGGVAQVWDLERAAVRVTIPGKAIRARWSPDGTRLATAGGDGLVRITGGLDGAPAAHGDRATILELPPRGPGGGATTVDWLDDRRVVVGDREGWLRVHAATGGPAIAEHRATRPVLDVLADPGGVITLPFNSEIAERWEPDGGRAFPLAGHALAIDAVDASADGDVLATAGADGTLMLWQGHDGRLTRTLTGHRGSINALAFAGDDVISGGSDGTLRVWRPSATVVRAAHAGSITTLAATADGSMFASGDSDGGVALWTAAELTGPETLPVAGVTSILVDGDRWIALAPGRVTELRPTARPLPATPAPTGVEGPLQVSYRRAGGVAGDGTLAVPDGHDAVALDRAGAIRSRCALGAPVSHAAISRDGRWLAAAGPGGALVICHDGVPSRDASHRGGGVAADRGHTGAVWAIAFSPDGAVLASTGADGVVRMTEVATGETRRATLEAGATSLAWMADGRLVAATLDGDLVFVDRRARVASTLRGTGVLVNAIVALDERTLAVGHGDGVVALVDPELGRVARWTVGGAVTWLALAGPRLIAVHAGGVVALDLGAPLTREARRALVRCRTQLEMSGGGLRRAPRRCS